MFSNLIKVGRSMSGRRSTLRYLILYVLAVYGPMDVARINRRISALLNGVWEPSSQAIRSELKKLARQGLVERKSGGARPVVGLTELGRQVTRFMTPHLYRRGWTRWHWLSK